MIKHKGNWHKRNAIGLSKARPVSLRRFMSFRSRALQEGAALGARRNRNARPIANLSRVQNFQQKKAESSDQQETRRTRYWHPQRNVFVGAPIR